MLSIWLHATFYFLIISFHQTSAILVNITVDDDGQDPNTGRSIQYAPPMAWATGQNCSSCLAKPDPSQAHNGTWHDGTYRPNPESSSDENGVLTATFQFSGTALYVFCILAHAGSPLASTSDMTFTLDGNIVGTFFQLPTGSSNFDFNVPVYVNSSIPDGLHTFTLTNGRDNGVTSLTLFDYYIYTQNTSSAAGPGSSSNGTSIPLSSTSSSPSTGMSTSSSSTASRQNASVVAAVGVHHGLSKSTRLIVIIAASIGGPLLIVILSAFIIWHRRRYGTYGPPSETDGGGPRDGASGWANDTWGPKTNEEPIHPSLLTNVRTKKSRFGFRRTKDSTRPATATSSQSRSQPSLDVTERSKLTAPLTSGGVSINPVVMMSSTVTPIPAEPPAVVTKVVTSTAINPTSRSSRPSRGPDISSVGREGPSRKNLGASDSRPIEIPANTHRGGDTSGSSGHARNLDHGHSTGNRPLKVNPSVTRLSSPPVITPTSATYILSPDHVPSMPTSASVRSPQSAGTPLTTPLSGSLSGEIMSPKSPSISPSYILPAGLSSSVGGHEPMASDLGAAIYPPLKPSHSFSSAYPSLSETASTSTPASGSQRPKLTTVRILPKVPSSLSMETASAISLSRAPSSSVGSALSRGPSAVASIPEDVSPTGTSPPGRSRRLPRPKGIIGPSPTTPKVEAPSVAKESPSSSKDEPDRPPSYDTAPR